ncbi:MAG TPA: methyltransferase domain-containing protein [Mariprofundaceae bacterium]|nr:methyltransferase domain-containing protein [Mariprofundaceae bacterium]
MSDIEVEWEGRYQRGETGWDRRGINPLLNSWMVASLTSGASVLIPGCGHGYEVIELARLGFEVTGIDISPTPVARMKRELENEGLSAEVIQIDMFDFVPTEPFDAIYEQTSLCAIQLEQREAYEKRLYRWLKPGGSLFALFMQTGIEGGPPFHCDVAAMRELFDASRWDWESDAAQHSPHPSGRHELGHRLIRR